MSLVDNNWDYCVDFQALEDDLFNEFEPKLNLIHEQVLTSVKKYFPNYKISSKENKQDHNDVELKSLVKTNKQLKQNLEEKLEELKRFEAQYQNFKQESKLLRQEISDTHEALLMAKKYYKKFLKIYYTIESTKDSKQIIFLQFFTEARKKFDKYSVRLARDTESFRYELIDMNPKLKQFSEIQKELHETNDVPGTLSFIRQCFLNMKK